MVKSYLKYDFSKSFGLIASSNSNVLWTASAEVPSAVKRSGEIGNAVVGANEEVLRWDLKKGSLISRWREDAITAQVTRIARSCADPDIYAVGYSDGSIRVWDSRLGSVLVSFNGHKSAITSLVFDKDGVRLASGAQDTDITVWDLVAEKGLFKLKGHKNQITGLTFIDVTSETQEDEEGENGTRKAFDDELDGDCYLLSTGKDGLIKLWDLNSQHCIETHIAHQNGECWALSLAPSHDGCITAGNEGELRIWQIDLLGLRRAASSVETSKSQQLLQSRGSIYRHDKDRTLGVHFHKGGKYIAAHGAQKSVEIFRLRSAAEVKRSLARKRQRKREKEREKEDKHQAQDQDLEIQDDETSDTSGIDISEFVVQHLIVRPGGKAKSVEWCLGSKKQLQLLILTSNNQLEVFEIEQETKGRQSKSGGAKDYTRVHGVDIPGHRTDIRTLALSSDDRMLASVSNGSLKIWNLRTQTCIRSLECGYAMCSAFLPGDKIVIIGTKTGELELFDIASSTLIETVKAHDGSIFALQVHPDGKSVVTGSGDKTAKFWTFSISQEAVLGSTRTIPQLKLIHSRTLKVADEILSLRYSPDAKYIAVALLDYTVKVFFADTLKMFLNLYGHKLPVLSMDISYDSKLIVTCSADKNVRVWGLDFGDCHKAFFAHKDSVMQVGFVPHNKDGNGHHFFSASKDSMIKYWDGDKFEQIQRLGGHHGEIWALAVGRTGDFIVSAAHDRCIRVWEQTEEQIFLEEEREKELEEMYEKTLTTSLEQDDYEDGEKPEVVDAGLQTAETLMAGERIMEALDLGLEDLQLIDHWEASKKAQPNVAPPQRNLIFMAHGNISAEEYVLKVIQRIKAAGLQDALLVLPLERVMKLFRFIEIWARCQWDTSLTCRVLFFLLKTHYRQIVASRSAKAMLESIRYSLRRGLQQQKDEVGFNAAALRVLSSQVKAQNAKRYVDDDDDDDDESWQDGGAKQGMKKRAFIDVA